MSALAKLPHGIANAVADTGRGLFARCLTEREQAFVTEAFGRRVDPASVRIVEGAGNSTIALAAFIKGNPAITIGNTMYIWSNNARIKYHDLTANRTGTELLVHEYTHVVQYATLGFGAFGKRYAAELAAAGGDPDKLYDYESRK